MENNEKIEKNILNNVLYWVFTCVFVVALIFGCGFLGMHIFDRMYQYYPVSGTSMQPTINPDAFLGSDEDKLQDGVFIRVGANVEYRDIAIIQRPNEKNTVIKRVIAKEGDWISICVDPALQGTDEYNYNTYVIRSGTGYIQQLNEDYTEPADNDLWISRYPARYDSDSYYTYERDFYNGYFANPVNLNQIKVVEYNGKKMKFYVLGKGEMFYMGDHRSNSGDARNSGIAQEDWVVGKVVCIVHNAKQYRDNGTLWWAQLKSMMGYFWKNISNFLSW